MKSDTIVLQSYKKPVPQVWLELCLDSVSRWADFQQFDYLFTSDELFDSVPADILHKPRLQTVVATDLARLLNLQLLLKQGYQTVIWCDADFLIFDPEQFVLSDTNYALGREVWVQYDNKNKLRVYRKVHNAFLMFRQGNAFLDFYTETAKKLLTKVIGPVPPQFIGPKLLTALHNIALCPIQETAGMLNPLVIEDIIKGHGDAFDLFVKQSPEPIGAANLCNSLLEKGELSNLDMIKVIEILLKDGHKLFR